MRSNNNLKRSGKAGSTKSIQSSENSSEPQLKARKLSLGERALPFENSKTTLQLQLSDALLRLKQIQQQMRVESRKSHRKKRRDYSIDDISSYEDEIKSKDRQIKRVGEQIKQLKAFKRKQEKTLKQHNKSSEYQVEDLTEISQREQNFRHLKNTLQGLQNEWNQKQGQIEAKKELVANLNLRYVESCRLRAEEPLSFDDFVRKQSIADGSELSGVGKRPQNTAIKDIISTIYSGEGLQCSEQNHATLKARKEVVETSMKNTKRKHQKEIEELRLTLDLLTQQNQTMDTKLKEKLRQKQQVQLLRRT